MHIVTSFHSSRVGADDLNAIMANHMALERARRHRKSFVTGFGLLALVIAVARAGFHWLSGLPVWLGVGVCLAAPVWAWVIELSCDWRLARRLNEIPDASHVAMPPVHARKS